MPSHHIHPKSTTNSWQGTTPTSGTLWWCEMMGIGKRCTVGSFTSVRFCGCKKGTTAAHLRSWARLSPRGRARILRGFSSWNAHVWAGSRVKYRRVPVTPIPILCCNHPRRRNPPRKTWSRAGKGSLNSSSARQKKKGVNKKKKRGDNVSVPRSAGIKRTNPGLFPPRRWSKCVIRAQVSVRTLRDSSQRWIKQ